MTRVITAVLCALAAAGLFGCASSTTSAEVGSGSTSSSPGDDPVIREENCRQVDEYYNRDVEDAVGNTYDQYLHAEVNLWLQISDMDKSSFDAIMDLRRVYYASNVFSPPALGDTITEENSEQYRTEYPTIPDTEKRVLIDKFKEVCPSVRFDFIDRDFGYFYN